ncbi:hypothetical protein ACB098_03G084900 [Castanea mollissima]|uniref:B-like cyclin n=1 Tax=Castanea mollissima TaxID=60419 RepID=A0A8J4Q1W0_9ROSI|nr:hypothetical protein CMV_030003 [Castanea mollissima]
MRVALSRAKRKLETKPAPLIKKKLRSELPRRRRSQISPILYSSLTVTLPCKNSGSSAFLVDSSSCSYFGSEVSCDSSRVSVGSENKPSSNLRKRNLGEIEGSGAVVKANAPVGRVTRSYYRKKENEGKVGEAEVSESSCVESNSEVDVGVFVERSSKLKSKSGKLNEITEEIEENGGSEAVSKSEISFVEQVSDGILNFSDGNVKVNSEFNENEVVSVASAAKLAEEATEQVVNRASEFEFSEISGNLFDVNITVPNSESTIDQKQKSFEFDSDLACTEQFSYEDVSEYSSSFQSEIFLESSDLEFSDYTPSIFFETGSEFSERSEGDSTPSRTFSLLLQYREDFSRSTTPLDTRISPRLENENHHQSTSVRVFEDEVDEESYVALRNRERRQLFPYNYAEEYCSTTDYGDLVLQLRSQMVHWIVEQSTEKELHQETMFLGVTLLDRFLSKGFFRDKRHLQIVGIACLTLATRIEEKQPHNSVQEKYFFMGSNVYSRFEVVAMEWLIQEILNFQCFLPTIHNFLWFYLKAAKADAELEKRAKYLAVLVLSVQEQLCYWPSTIAAALVILACLDSRQYAFQRVLETHIRTKDHDIHECIENLEWLLRYI